MAQQRGWRPLNQQPDFDVLTERFPPYLREPVAHWLFAHANMGSQDNWLRYQLEAHDFLGFRHGHDAYWDRDILPLVRKMEVATLTNVIDWALFQMQSGVYARFAPDLDAILSSGSSKWQIGVAGHQGLVERVPEGVRESVDVVLSQQSLASDKLREAWVAAYGVSPNPSNAYRLAVIAVEIAALQVVKVNKPDPTLANVFGQLETQKGWVLPFRSSERAPGAETLAKMMRLLWRGHSDRHGAEDYTEVTDVEARAAVMLSVTLVGWLTSGALRRQTQDVVSP